MNSDYFTDYDFELSENLPSYGKNYVQNIALIGIEEPI